MECRHGNFWIGLGLGSILGAIAYRLSRTAKAKQLENEIYDAIHPGLFRIKPCSLTEISP